MHKTVLGDYQLSSRIGLSYGDISWKVFGSDRKAYCFYGDPIIECAEITTGKNPGEITLSQDITSRLSDDIGRIVMQKQDADVKPLSRIKRSLVKQFFPKAVLSAGYGGEFRNVVPVFTAFK